MKSDRALAAFSSPPEMGKPLASLATVNLENLPLATSWVQILELRSVWAHASDCRVLCSRQHDGGGSGFGHAVARASSLGPRGDSKNRLASDNAKIRCGRAAFCKMPQMRRTGFPYVRPPKDPARNLWLAQLSLEVALLDLRLSDDRNRRRAQLNLSGGRV